MAKKNPDKSPFSITTKAEREGSIQKKLDELNSLQVGLVGLDKKGKKVDNLINPAIAASMASSRVECPDTVCSYSSSPDS